ncbi:MAG TPA: amino acid ABC transporter permease [Virgibacillus sp.]|nr:amino acid ABC transporter permease [Virgibacillus sp.]HLR69344.1 amino acid ABC transporter permease [Virgibacillus sp.]
MDILLENSPLLLKGLVSTITLSISCLLLSVVAGTIIGVLRTTRNVIVLNLAKLYINLFRGLPILVTLFMTFFLLPEFNIELNPYFSAMAGLSVWCSANIAEAVRGAIQSIPPTQTEASLSLGLKPLQTMRYVILPQAVRRMLPSIISLLANMVHATSLSVLIGNMELLKTAQLIIERIEVMQGIPVALMFYFVILLMYFVICYPLSLLSKRMEKAYS